jgi:hypothetical protein
MEDRQLAFHQALAADPQRIAPGLDRHTTGDLLEGVCPRADPNPLIDLCNHRQVFQRETAKPELIGQP